MILKQKILDFKDIISKIQSSTSIGIEEYGTLLKELREEKYILDDLGISSRNYNAWKESGIGFSRVLEGKQREVARFSFIDAFYLLIVKQLKRLGLEHKDIVEFKSQMYFEMPLLLSPLVFKRTNTVAKLGSTPGNQTMTNNIHDFLHEITKSEIFQKFIENNNGINISHLASILILTLSRNYNANIFLVDFDLSIKVGFVIYDGGHHQILEKLFRENLVQINFWATIQPLLGLYKTSGNVLRLLPTDFQQKLLMAVNEKTPISKIFVDDVNSSSSLRFTEERDVDLSRKIELVVGENSNQDIIIKVRNSKKTSIKKIVYEKKDN